MGILQQSMCDGSQLLTIQKTLKGHKNNSILFLLHGDGSVRPLHDHVFASIASARVRKKQMYQLGVGT